MPAGVHGLGAGAAGAGGAGTAGYGTQPEGRWTGEYRFTPLEEFAEIPLHRDSKASECDVQVQIGEDLAH